MKIRTRLTLWYAGILIVSLVVVGLNPSAEIAEQMENGPSIIYGNMRSRRPVKSFLR